MKTVHPRTRPSERNLKRIYSHPLWDAAVPDARVVTIRFISPWGDARHRYFNGLHMRDLTDSIRHELRKRHGRIHLEARQ